MIFGTVIRRGLLPAAVVVAEAKSTGSKESGDQSDKTCRPSELPIYVPDPPIRHEAEQQPSEPDVIENTFKSIRETWTMYSDELRAYERVASDKISDGRQNVQWLIDYLRQEDNTLPKAGAIGIGAFTGLILGLRGGLIKKTLYASTGALAMGAVCYPKEASEYSTIVATEGKKYLTIAYNFAYGVKKDDPPLELPSLPKLPTSLSEAWDSAKSGASSFFSDKSSSLDEVKNTSSEPKKSN